LITRRARAARTTIILVLLLAALSSCTTDGAGPPTATADGTRALGAPGSTFVPGPLAGSVPTAVDTAPPRPARPPLRPGVRVVGYFSSRSMGAIPGVADRPIPEAVPSGLTHIIVGVTLDVREGRDRCAPTDVDRRAMDYLAALKREHPQLHVLLGINGAESFRTTLSAATRRTTLLASCTTLLQDRAFDGFDVDWEFPQNAADARTFVTLMTDLRSELDALGRGHLDLSMATATSLPTFAFYDWPNLDRVVDWFNVMTYEYGPQFRTALNTPLHRPSRAIDAPTAYAIDDTMALYRDAGVPPQKVLFGLAFYGHVWHGVAPANDGLYQPHDPPPTTAARYIDYRDIPDDYPADAYHRDPAADVPWIYDPGSRTMISYDDEASLTAKATYAHDHGAGGVMIFRVESDGPAAPLFEAVHAALQRW
jgi:chitinase